MSKEEKAKQAPPRKEKGKFLKSAAIDAEAKEVMLNVSSSDPTQLHRWLEAMQLEANRLFPHLADIILVKKYPEIKAPEDSHVLYDDINDPSSFFRQTRSAKIKKAVDLEAKLEDAKCSLFSIMLQHMSSNSIQRVKVAVHKIVISNRELAWSNERATRTEAREELKRRQGIRKRMKARAESKTKAKEKAIKKLSDRYDAKRKDALHARKSAQDKRTAYDIGDNQTKVRRVQCKLLIRPFRPRSDKIHEKSVVQVACFLLFSIINFDDSLIRVGIFNLLT